jgi:hypothetical protein
MRHAEIHMAHSEGCSNKMDLLKISLHRLTAFVLPQPPMQQYPLVVAPALASAALACVP